MRRLKFYSVLGTKITSELFKSYIHPDDRDYVEKKWKAVLNNEPYDIELRIIVNDKVRWIREKAEFKFDKKGNPISAIGVTQDITERKQTEEKIKRNNIELLFLNNIAIKLVQLTHSERIEVFLTKQIMEYSAAEVAVFSLYDPDKRVLITKHIETDRYILKKAVEIGGDNILETESSISAEVYAMMVDTIIGVSSTLTEVTFGAIPVTISKAIQLITGIDRFYAIAHVIDGNLFGTTVLGYKIGKPAPRKDLLKSFSYLTAISLKRIRVEKELLKSEERFRLLAEYSTDMISRNSPDGIYLYVSPACERLPGYSSEELIGHSAFEFILSDDIPKVEQSRTINIEQKAFSTTSYRICRKDGKQVWLETTSHTIQDPQTGEIMEIHAATRDITERILAEREISRQLSEKEIILKETHHRIKNNFATITSLLSLQADSATNSEVQAALQDAAGRVDSMEILYEKLLLTDKYQTTSAKEYLDHLIDDIKNLFPENIKFVLKKDIDDFQLDSKHLIPIGIIVNEILTNIMKYAFIDRSAGIIEVILKGHKGNATLSVRDNGMGLPAGFDIEKQKGFGLMLIKMLTEQLEGNYTFSDKQGWTESILKFPI